MSTPAQLVSSVTGEMSLSGHLTADQAESIRRQGADTMASWPSTQPWRCDLSQLVEGSSIAAAVFLAWQSDALRRGTQLSLVAVPPKLHAILTASGLDDLFSLTRMSDDTPSDS